MKRTNPPSLDSRIEFLVIEAFKSTGYLIVNKTLIKQFGLLPAILLSNYIDKHIYFREKFPDNDGWFFLTHENQMNQLGMAEYSIRKYKTYLKDKGIIKTTQKGIPAKEWYKIDFQKLVGYLGQDLPKTTGQEPKISKGLYKDTNKIKENKIRINKKEFSLLENLPNKWKDNQPFQESLQSYLTHRKEKRQTLTPEACKRLAKKLSKYSISTVINALNNSVDNGWTGVFPESVNKNVNKSGSRRGSAESPNFVEYDEQL